MPYFLLYFTLFEKSIDTSCDHKNFRVELLENFRENWHTESYTFRGGVNELLSVLPTLIA